MALVRNLKEAVETLGVFPPRESNPMADLMFRTETLHDLAVYATSAYSVREQIETLIGKRKTILSNQDGDITLAFDDAYSSTMTLPSTVFYTPSATLCDTTFAPTPSTRSRTTRWSETAKPNRR